MASGESPPNGSTPTLTDACSYTIQGNEPWISRPDMGRLRQLAEMQDPTDPSASRAHSVKALPSGCKLVGLVGEGAANAVFEFQLPDGGYLYHGNTRLLLRVAKEPLRNERPGFDYIEQQWYHHTLILPILGASVLHYELAVIRNSGIVDDINEHLRRIDQTRKGKFRGSFVSQSDWGFLVEDMRPEGDDGLLVEFKPKWMSQSPSAPSDAVRCRQCAKELHSYVVDPDLSNPVPTMAKPCPLTLGRDGYNAARKESARSPLPRLEMLNKRGHLNATLNVLRDEPALKQLRMAQEKYDRVGPLKADESDDGFSLAMTLRDCTCLAHVPRQSPGQSGSVRPLKVRFGDFDMKNSRFRLEYWRMVEQKLIDGGFYTATWISCRGLLYRPPTQCVLELQGGGRRNDTELMCILDDGVKNGTDADVAVARLGQWSRVYTVKTDEVKLQQCLEAHVAGASEPTE